MQISFMIKYIVLPLIFAVYYLFDTKNREDSFKLAKSIWYFYYAIFTIVNLVGGDISNNDLAGFTVSLALLEGFPGFCTLWKVRMRILSKGSNNSK